MDIKRVYCWKQAHGSFLKKDGPFTIK